MLTFNFWLFSISAAFPSTGVASVHNLVELFIFSHMSTSSRSDTWLWEIYSFIPSQSNENGDQPPNMIPYSEWLEIVLWLQVLEHCCAVCLFFLLRQICPPIGKDISPLSEKWPVYLGTAEKAVYPAPLCQKGTLGQLSGPILPFPVKRKIPFEHGGPSIRIMARLLTQITQSNFPKKYLIRWGVDPNNSLTSHVASTWRFEEVPRSREQSSLEEERPASACEPV